MGYVLIVVAANQIGKSQNVDIYGWQDVPASLAMGMQFQHVPAVSGLSRLMGRSHGSSYTHVPWRVVL